MAQCKICGSHAFNLRAEGIDQGELCDRHYYQAALAAKTADFDRLCKDFDALNRVIAGLQAKLQTITALLREAAAWIRTGLEKAESLCTDIDKALK